MKPYNSRLKGFARNLRKKSTYGEKKLWKALNNSQLGFKFRRQHPLLKYIVDFYCIELRLAIEIDGRSHEEHNYDYDRFREKELEKVGVKFLRFSENEVLTNTYNVLQSIENFINDHGFHTSPESSPPTSRGRPA